MCIATPGRILDVTSDEDVLIATVQFPEVTNRVCLDLVPEAKVGDYVLVYTGFARVIIDEEEARILMELHAEMTQLLDLTDAVSTPTLHRKTSCQA